MTCPRCKTELTEMGSGSDKIAPYTIYDCKWCGSSYREDKVLVKEKLPLIVHIPMVTLVREPVFRSS